MGFHHEEPGAEANSLEPPCGEASQPDFQLAIYSGCVLPEDQKPARITSWAAWSKVNLEDYGVAQLDQIRIRLLAGKPWVCFGERLETIVSPDFYKPNA